MLLFTLVRNLNLTSESQIPIMLLLVVNQVNALKRTHMHARDYKRTAHMLQMKPISNVSTFPSSVVECRGVCRISNL